MANFNQVTLLGHLTRDVELRHTQGGTPIGKFGMAINHRYTPKDGGEAKETVCFVDMTAWGKAAELLAQYVGKGSQLFVSGRLNYSTWESQSGGQMSKLDVVVEQFQFIGDKRKGGDVDATPKGKVKADEPVDYGDIPF